MLSDLLLDVRFHIATFDEEVWYFFYKHFDDFKLLTCHSIPLFIQLFTKKHLFDNRIEYRLLGRLHRDDGPAVECTDGTLYWYQHGKITMYGKLHRDDGPAIIYSDGNQYWYQHGNPNCIVMMDRQSFMLMANNNGINMERTGDYK